MAAYEIHNSGCPFCHGVLSLAQCDQQLFNVDLSESSWGTQRRR